MTEIIGFGEIARMKRELAEKDARIAQLVEAVKDAQTVIRTHQGLNDLLRMQFNDILATIDGWQESLTQVKINVLELKHRLPEA